MSDSFAAILAAGDFPTHPEVCRILRRGAPLVCCDGASQKALARGLRPDVILGDLDSIDASARDCGAQVVRIEEQETNDLAKAFRYVLERNIRRVCVFGATGGREDHTLGNLGQFADFAPRFDEAVLYTDTGRFLHLSEGASLSVATVPEQPVSLVPLASGTRVYGQGLRWPLNGQRLDRWWQATLNRASGEKISVRVEAGEALLYLALTD
ncbi:MAG: thiamine diphosphokinase [Kiritimatiellia bacterium]